MRNIHTSPKRFYRNVKTLTNLQRQIKIKKLYKEEIEEQIADEEKLLMSIEKKTAHFQELYSGLETAKTLLSDPTYNTQQKLAILKNEIQRLETVVAKQREDLQQISYTNPLTLLNKPTLRRTLRPVKMYKNYKKYAQQKREFNKAVKTAQKAEVHLAIVKEKGRLHIQNNGTRSYKPEYISVYPGHIAIGEKLVSTYYLSDIPAYLSPYVFFKLLTSSLPFTISVFVEPTVSSSLIKKARQRLSVLEMQQNERTSKGKVRDQKIDKSLEEITSFIEELVHEVEKGIVYSLYLSLQAKDSEELKKLHKELKNITDAIELNLTRYMYGQKKAFETMLSFNNDKLKQNRILQSTAASYLMPFVTKQIHDPEGIFFGINAYHASLVFLNPFTVRNSNINILGVSGAGKSVTAKTLATRLYVRGTQIIIIDPEGEYVNFAKALGGEVIQFSRENGINPFSVGSYEKDEIYDHIAVLKTFFKFFIPEDRYDGAILDKALVSLYKVKNPTFDKFLKLIAKDPMYEYLNVLSKGSLQGIFNAKRELELENVLIVFDISPLGDP